jgi:hypothetical protein
MYKCSQFNGTIKLKGVYWIEISKDYFDKKNLEDFK